MGKYKAIIDAEYFSRQNIFVTILTALIGEKLKTSNNLQYFGKICKFNK
jgi:hypothetical protein